MTYHLFKLSILCAAVFAICAGTEITAQDQDPKEGKPKSEQAETKQAETKPAGKQADTKPQQKDAASKQQKINEEETFLLDIEMTDICGKKVNLKKYEGKVVLIVNVASKCGFTGQYRPLQALHNQYNKHGLEVVAFPCNQFGKQEPKNEEWIDEFCKKKFGIRFDMYSKVHVKGEKQAELFKRLTQCELKPAGKGDIRWNFEKFLIGKDGKPVARFRSNIAPDNEAVISKLKEALGIADEKLKSDEKDAKSTKQDAEKKKATKVKEDKKS